MKLNSIFRVVALWAVLFPISKVVAETESAEDGCVEVLQAADENIFSVDEAAYLRMLPEALVLVQIATQTVDNIVKAGALVSPSILVEHYDAVLGALEVHLSGVLSFYSSPLAQVPIQLREMIGQLRPLRNEDGSFKYPQTYTLENIQKELKSIRLGVERQLNIFRVASAAPRASERDFRRQMAYLCLVLEELAENLSHESAQLGDDLSTQRYLMAAYRLSVILDIFSDYIVALEKMDPNFSESHAQEIGRFVNVALKEKMEIESAAQFFHGIFSKYPEALAQGTGLQFRLSEDLPRKLLAFTLTLAKRVRHGLLPLLSYPVGEEFDPSRWPENIHQDYMDAFADP